MWEGRVLCASKTRARFATKWPARVCLAEQHGVMLLFSWMYRVSRAVVTSSPLRTMCHESGLVFCGVQGCGYGTFAAGGPYVSGDGDWYTCVRLLRTFDFPSSPLSPLPVPPFVKLCVCVC